MSASNASDILNAKYLINVQLAGCCWQYFIFVGPNCAHTQRTHTACAYIILLSHCSMHIEDEHMSTNENRNKTKPTKPKKKKKLAHN